MEIGKSFMVCNIHACSITNLYYELIKELSDICHMKDKL